MSLSSGAMLGPYEVVGPLGAGGMGEVYRARDTRLGRMVAVKVLTLDSAASPVSHARFEREARTVSQLSHPHICALHDIGSQDGNPFLVMELLEGETLADRLQRGPLPIDDVFRYGSEICEALSHAHQQDIVHRDLKPGNVMLTKQGAKLLDFGLAQAIRPDPLEIDASGVTVSTHLTREGTVVGTPQYMAPEQIEGNPVDARADVFALGGVLYEMTTGKRAFEGKTVPAVIGAVLKDHPAKVSQTRPEAPPALDRLIEGCLAKDPEHRIQSAHDVMLQLRWISEGGSSDQSSSAPQGTVGRWFRGSRRSLLATATGVVVLLGAGVWMSFFRGSGPVTGGAASSIESIVALPATIHSGVDDNFLADAVPGALSTALGQVAGLVTKLPPSSADFERIGGNLDALAKAFAVQAFVVTAVTARADGLTLSVQLVHAASRSLLWSRDYEGQREGFLDLIHQASAGLQQAIRPGIAPRPGGAVTAEESKVELLFQRGRYHSRRFRNLGTREDYEPALAAFQKVLALDPRRADAAAMIADVILARVESGLATPEETLPEVDIWAHRAIEIDPRTGIAWAGLAAAERASAHPSYRKTLEYALRGARYSEGRAENLLGVVLSFSAYRLGLVMQREAALADPLYGWPPAFVGLGLLALDRSAEGLALVDDALSLEENAAGPLMSRAALLIDLGRFDQAPAGVERLSHLPPGVQAVRIGFEYALVMRRGRAASAPIPPIPAELLAALVAPRMNSQTRWQGIVTPVASILARHGAPETALDLLVKVTQPGLGVPAYDWMALNPDFDPVRADPRFKKVLGQARAQFDEMVLALDAARARGELPAPLEKPLEDLRLDFPQKE